MIKTKDKILSECYPDYISWDEYLEDCEKAVNISELHSDEYSSNDETLAQEEMNRNQRPS